MNYTYSEPPHFGIDPDHDPEKERADEVQRHDFKNKLIFTFSVFVLLFSFVILKSFYVQVISRDKLLTYLESQILRVNKFYPNRGNIFDRNGEPLAINVQTFEVFCYPKLLSSKKEGMRKLAKIVPQLNFDKMYSKIKNRDQYTWLARKIRLTKQQVEGLKKIEGIYVGPSTRRLYPNGELLSQVLGFVGVDNNGLAGIEYQLNDFLHGEPTVIKYFKDAKGRPVKIESQQFETMNESVYLTVDKSLQAVVEKYLKEAVLEHNALKAGAGVIDAATGEILAIANYPTFDPNHIKKSDRDHLKLSFINEPFEPGSIMKALTITSALEHNIVRPNSHYYCERGKFKVQGHTISEAETSKIFEWLTVSEILQNSSNIGTTKIAFDLTYPKLKTTLEKFRVGQKTGIELPGESRGILTDKQNVQPLTLSNISFGQGVATTGIQMLGAFAALANGGVYNPPTILKKTNEKLGRQNISSRILSPEIAEQVSKMLFTVVEKGSGVNAQIPHFQIAGKTSTAQKPDGRGGYSGHISGFIGYPLNVKNRFVVYVYVDEPKGRSYYGGQIAAPVFKKIAQYMLYKNKDFQGLTQELAENHNNPVIDVINSRAASARVLGEQKVPVFLGLDKFSSIEMAKKFNLKLNIKGAGVVSEQYPSAGTPIPANTGTPGENAQSVNLIFSLPKYE